MLIMKKSLENIKLESHKYKNKLKFYRKQST